MVVIIALQVDLLGDELFEAHPGRRLPLSLSVGAAIFPHDGDSYEALLATADSRMYQDKARRKRDAIAGPVPGAQAGPAAPSTVSEVDLRRAAAGVL